MSSNIYNKLLKIAGFTAVAVSGIALANKLMAKHALSNDSPVAQEHYYEWSYGKIFYTRQGQGHPLLFIHGLYPGANSYPFHDLADSLSDHYTVYTIDLPGFGLSDKPQLTYTSFFYAHMLNEFIEKVIQAPVYLLAEDLSCTFCSIACQVQPHLYSKMIFINPPSHEDERHIPTTFHRFMRHIFELPLLGTFIYNLACRKKQLRALYGNTLDEDTLRILYARAHRKITGARYAYASLKNNYMNANLSRSLSKLDTSVYIILTGYMEQASEQIDYLHTVNSSIETEFLGGNKHFGWLEEPTDILEICHFFF